MTIRILFIEITEDSFPTHYEPARPIVETMAMPVQRERDAVTFEERIRLLGDGASEP